MSLLDRWLALRFLRAYVTFTGSGALVFVVIDLFTQLESLERRGSLLEAAARRYATMLPELFLTLSPFLVLIAALWVVATLRRHNELIPLLAAGVSPRRLAAPLLVVGALFAPVVWADRELLLPRLHHLRRSEGVLRQLAEVPRPVPDEEGGVLAPRLYVPTAGELQEVRYTRLDDRDQEAVSIFAARARHVPGGWWLEEGFTIERRPGGIALDAIAPIPSGGVLLRSTILVDDVEAAVEAPSYLSAKQLRRQLRRTPGFSHIRVQLYERYSYPLAGLVLLLVSMPIALGGDGLVDAFVRMLACGALSVLFFVVSNLAYQLGAREVVQAEVAAIGPVVLFGAAGLWLMARAQR